MKRRCLTSGSVVQYSGKPKGFTLSRCLTLIILFVYFTHLTLCRVISRKGVPPKSQKKLILPFLCPGKVSLAGLCRHSPRGTLLAMQEEYFYPLFLKTAVRQLPDELTLLTEEE